MYVYSIYFFKQQQLLLKTRPIIVIGEPVCLQTEKTFH